MSCERRQMILSSNLLESIRTYNFIYTKKNEEEERKKKESVQNVCGPEVMQQALCNVIECAKRPLCSVSFINLMLIHAI